MAEQYDVPLLGALPLDIHIREQADGGTPTVVADPDRHVARDVPEIARKTAAQSSLHARCKTIQFPKNLIQEHEVEGACRSRATDGSAAWPPSTA